MASTSSPTNRNCPVCGSIIPPDAPCGHCPKCLAQLGLNAASDALHTEMCLQNSRRFGSYILGPQVGRGGMGVVYEAWHEPLKRKVALKFIVDAQLSSPIAMRRFMIEAEATAKLDHPNIVPIYEVGDYEGQPFISMKLITGENLRSKIARGDYGFGKTKEDQQHVAWKNREERIARIMSILAHAVQHAHQRGVLHRDLKPGNILIDEHNQPYLTDFGLAKISDPNNPTDKDPSVTLSGALLGTPGYMAPEQVSHNPVSVATDIYGLGAILYDLLTGRPPFQASTPVETIRMVQEQEPQHPRTYCRGIDRNLSIICLKCLEKNPIMRYNSADTLADDLDRWLRREPIHARSTGFLIHVGRWIQRNPVGTALIFTLCLGLGISLFLLGEVHKEKDEGDKRKDQVIELQREMWQERNTADNNPFIIKAERLAILANIKSLPQHLNGLKRLTLGVNISDLPVELAKNCAPFLNRWQQEIAYRLKHPVLLDLALCKKSPFRFSLVADDRLDFQRVNLLAYLQAKNKNAEVQAVISEHPSLKAVIFVRRDHYTAGITNIERLVGHSVVFGPTNDTISFLAKAALARVGIFGTHLSLYRNIDKIDEDDQQVIEKVQLQTAQTNLSPHLHFQRQIIHAVLTGEFDAGVVQRQLFIRDKKKDLVEIFQFDEPPNIYVARAGLEKEIIKAFQESLLAINSQEMLSNFPFQPVNKFLPISETQLSGLRTDFTNVIQHFNISHNLLSR